MIDQAKRDLAAREPEWDELRARRVLSRAERAVEDRAAQRPRNRVFLAAGSVLAVAAALGLWMASPHRAPPSRPTVATAEPAPTIEAPTEPTPASMAAPDPSRMVLADGSVARLSSGAEVVVTSQGPEGVRLSQSRGSVHYEVQHDPSRQFVVDAADVEVRVIGTEFTVDVDAGQVAVQVTRGVVEVDDHATVARLTAGDFLELSVASDEPTKDARIAEAPKSPGPPSVDALLTAADEARALKDYEAAARALRELVRVHAKDPQVPSAYMTLGLVERQRGRHAAAARAFRACHRRSPSGPLAESARAEQAVALDDAGSPDEAEAAAQAYLDRHPQGSHAKRMRSILDSR